MVPLYTAAALGYASVRWLKAFSDEQCAGINRFAPVYAVPVLVFHMVATNDPYNMSGRLVAADTLQKVATLLGLAAWALVLSSRRRRRAATGTGDRGSSAPLLRWVVTAFSLASLPNTTIIGVPLLGGMYGPSSSRALTKQILVMQFCVWYNVVIFLYEYMHMQAGMVDGVAKISPSPAPVTIVVVSTDHDQQAQQLAVNFAVSGHEAQHGLSPTTAAADEVSSTGRDVVVEVEVCTAPAVKHFFLITVKKILKAPNTYGSFLGLIWALVAFKCGPIKMPKIIDDSLFTIDTTATGLCMFSSGTFIARQARLVPFGYKIAIFAMILKFLVGPVVMLLASLVVGMHGTLLHIAVVQAALPLSLASFVYAEEYNVHQDVISTGVILGMFVSLPVTIVYNIVLGL